MLDTIVIRDIVLQGVHAICRTMHSRTFDEMNPYLKMLCKCMHSDPGISATLDRFTWNFNNGFMFLP